MLKPMTILVSLVFSVAAQAATLQVDCKGNGSSYSDKLRTLSMTVEIDNVHSRYQVSSVKTDGSVRELSLLTGQTLQALDTNGSFVITTAHSVNGKNILRINAKVENCKDSVYQMGVATTDAYKGGFDAREKKSFTCECSLK